MVRCNLGANQEGDSNKIWQKCKDNCKNLFFKEIELINPKLVLIMADSTYKVFISLLNESNIKIEDDVEFKFTKYLRAFPTRNFGYFVLNGNEIYVYHIYHVKKYYSSNEQTLRIPYRTNNQLFFSNEIKPKVLSWDE